MKPRSTIKSRGNGNVTVTGSSNTVMSTGKGNIISAGKYTISSPDQLVIIHNEDGTKRIVPFADRMKGNAVLLQDDDHLMVDGYMLTKDYEWDYRGKPPGLLSRFVDWMTGN